MSGHNKWSKIKHQKAITDVRKGMVFSKIIKAITIAARKGENPEMNSDLRMAIEKAKEVNVPHDRIENAIKKSTGENRTEQLEEATYEAYGPNGTPIIIEIITDNKNRTLSEIKHILTKNNGKLAESGSVKYLFNKKDKDWIPKYSINITDKKLKEKLKTLFNALKEHDDVQEIYSNIKL